MKAFKIKRIKNKKGMIVAVLYIDRRTGNLYEDSWLCHNGWPTNQEPC